MAYLRHCSKIGLWGGGMRKTMKLSVRTADKPIETLTGFLPNASAMLLLHDLLGLLRTNLALDNLITLYLCYATNEGGFVDHRDP